MTITESHPVLSGQEQSFPVRYASEVRFHKIWKLFPWEDYGLLTVHDNYLYLFSNTTTFEFPLENMTLEWKGMKYWPNGITSWFLIHYKNNRYYFTSDTGTWASNSEPATRGIYQHIKEKITLRVLNNSDEGIS